MQSNIIWKKDMQYENEFKQINQFINKSKNILIVPHIDPDPDALGASLSLVHSLNSINKNCFIGLQQELISKYEDIIKDKSILTYPENNTTSYDLIITVDIGEKNRVGKYIHLLDSQIPSVNIDHHIDNDHFADINIVDLNSSSTSEIVYNLIKFCQFKMIKEIAVALYIGIVYDTGSFRYSLTTKNTHKAVSELLEYDINTNEIYEYLFENLTLGAVKLRNMVTSTLELYHDGKIAITSMRKDFLILCNAQESDTTSLVKIGSSIKGVEFSIHINEKSEDLVKVSLRRKGITNVNQIAKLFGGGGHEKASGFVFNKSYDELKNTLLLNVINKYPFELETISK